MVEMVLDKKGVL